jgi:hypothetical protein
MVAETNGRAFVRPRDWAIRGRGLTMSDEPAWRAACRCVISDGVPRRSLLVALIVGTILNLINQGDALLAGGPIDWTKILLTFSVPYCVSTYGAVSYYLRVSRRPSAVEPASAPGHDHAD